MTEARYPAIAIHAGEIIKEEIETRGISQKAFAENLGVPYTMLNEILNAKRPVSSEFAILVEAALGISAEMLVSIQSKYDLQVARNDSALIRRVSRVKQMQRSPAL